MNTMEILDGVQHLIETEELKKQLDKVIVEGQELTWLGLTAELLPIVISSVENGKVQITSTEKANLVGKIILPLIKDKLPFYLKPFASMLIKYFIDIVVTALNKLFSHDWGEKIKNLFKKEKKEEKK